jgi:hypothetical protein
MTKLIYICNYQCDICKKIGKYIMLLIIGLLLLVFVVLSPIYFIGLVVCAIAIDINNSNSKTHNFDNNTNLFVHDCSSKGTGGLLMGTMFTIFLYFCVGVNIGCRIMRNKIRRNETAEARPADIEIV